MAGTETHFTLPLPKFEQPVKILMVVAPYYKAIADDMIAGATATLNEAGVSHDIVNVPGALEIPTAIALAHRHSNYDGFVAMGCVIRGATTHYETVCNDSSRALQLLGLNGLCIGNGILTVETMEQAQERASPEQMNKGGGAAAAALHLISLTRKWGTQGRGPMGFHGDSYQMAGGTDKI